MFEGQPKGLYALALANTGERFGYYTMLAIFVLFLQANFGFSEGAAGTIYGAFLMLVYFLPLVGGIWPISSDLAKWLRLACSSCLSAICFSLYRWEPVLWHLYACSVLW